MSLRLSIPVFVDHQRDDHGRARFRVRAALIPDFDEEEKDVREDRALNRFAEQLRKVLGGMYVGPDHRKLLPWMFAPPLTGHLVKLRIDLKSGNHVGSIYVAVFENAGRRVVVVPTGKGLSFEWPTGRRLEDVAQTALTPLLRKLEREEEDDFDVKDWFCGSQPHLSHVTVPLHGNQHLPKQPDLMQSLNSEQTMEGALELQKVGLCLDRMNPQDMDRALLRESEVKELMALFSKKPVHPPAVLLVGRSKVGKTALIHECVKRLLEVGSTFKRGHFWLVPPQRVISGMMYVGQWEQRWLAILTELRQKRHIMVLDDLLGLFEAGRSAGSELSLGHLLKARQEHEPVAILAEATPEVWARLRELDRSFASQFHVIHVREMSDPDTIRILVRTLQRLETDAQMAFAPEVLPLMMRLQQRFARSRAFPGKAVEMLMALSQSFASQSVADEDEPKVKPKPLTAAQAMRWFAERHGIRLSMIDPEQALTRLKMAAFFATRIMGQQAAVDAMIDTVLMASSEVNDPRRPLGSLLFLGPTGVGKTECARALAEFVFGSEERMFRFDLNEYNGDDALVRLIGAPGRSGLLTSRVKRQPFSLLLFDEVEKGHPDVFNLLLQVLGEGRLTDAQGQTADFCNCIIVLTSNLGAQQARRRLGFDEAITDEPELYRDAAEEFFRPEFFNRLDRIVAFHELGKKEIEQLAGTLAGKALSRQGVKDRRVDVVCDGAALEHLARKGFDRDYGARALRRAVEALLVEPLAAELLTWKAQRAIGVRVSVDDDRLRFEPLIHDQVEQVKVIPARLTHEQALAVLEDCHVLLDDVADQLEAWEIPEADGITELKAWYYLLRDALSSLRKRAEGIEDSLLAADRAKRATAASRGGKLFHEIMDEGWSLMPQERLATFLEELLNGQLTEEAVAEQLAHAQQMPRSTADVLRVLWASRWLNSLCDPALAKAERIVRTSQQVQVRWKSSPFFECREGVLEGYGLSALLDALDCPHAAVKDGVLQRWPVQESAGGVARFVAGDLVLDLRTGLLVKYVESEPLELTLAVLFGD